MYAAAGAYQQGLGSRGSAAAAGRARFYRRREQRKLFEDDGLPAPSDQVLDALPACVSDARQLQASADCTADPNAFGPGADPLVAAGLSECAISRMRVCGPGDAAELEKAGLTAAPRTRTLIIVGAVVVGGGLLYALFR